MSIEAHIQTSQNRIMLSYNVTGLSAKTYLIMVVRLPSSSYTQWSGHEKSDDFMICEVRVQQIVGKKILNGKIKLLPSSSEL